MDPTLDELRAEAEALLRDNPEGLEGAASTRFEELEAAIAREQQLARIRVAALDPRNVEAGEPGGDPERIEDPTRGNPWRAVRDGLPVAGSDLRARAVSAIEVAAGLSDDARQVATRFVEADRSDEMARWAMVSSDPLYARAFGRLAADPQRGHLGFTDDERRAFERAEAWKRAMTSVDSAGGFLVPTHLDASIVLTNTGTIDPIRQLAQVETIAVASWNGVSSAGVTAEWLAEAAEAADASPTLAQPTIPVHKASAYVEMSFEIAGDSNIQDQLGRLFADAKARHEATAWISGTGSGQPTGLVTALDGGASEVAPAVAETFAVGDVYSTLEALPPRHRLRASWTLGLPTINTIHRFFNPSGSEPPLIEGDRLLRKRFYENSEMRDTSDIDTGATADNFLLMVGDFKEYRIVDRVGSTVEFIQNVVGANRRPTGERGALYWWRVGANVTHIDAFRVLNVATTA